MIVDGEGQKSMIKKTKTEKKTEPKKSQKAEMKAVKWKKKKKFQTILIKFCNKLKKWPILIMKKQSVTTQHFLFSPDC